jgi:hypothetical protein
MSICFKVGPSTSRSNDCETQLDRTGTFMIARPQQGGIDTILPLFGLVSLVCRNSAIWLPHASQQDPGVEQAIKRMILLTATTLEIPLSLALNLVAIGV